MNKVVVIGSDHHNTLGVVQSLGQKGVSTYVIIDDNPRKSFVLASKYIAKGWICKDNSEVINCITDNFSQDIEKAIVISTNDNIAALLDAHYDDFKTFLLFPNCKRQGALRDWMNKEKMNIVAADIGMQVPLSWTVKQGDSLSGIPFPVITKSISSLEGGKSNIHICKTQKELDNALLHQSSFSFLQVQQFINKDFEFQLIGCSLGGGDEIIIPGRTHIDRPKGIDNTFFLHYLPLDDSFTGLLNKVKTFIKKTGYSGTFSVEFLRDKNGNDYFLEMNYRNDGNAKCITAAGVNIPYIWYLYNSGGNYKKEIEESAIHRISFVPEKAYFIQMLLREVNIKRFLINICNSDSYAVFSKYDIKPFISGFFSFNYLMINKTIKTVKKIMKRN